MRRRGRKAEFFPQGKKVQLRALADRLTTLADQGPYHTLSEIMGPLVEWRISQIAKILGIGDNLAIDHFGIAMHPKDEYDGRGGFEIYGEGEVPDQKVKVLMLAHPTRKDVPKEELLWSIGNEPIDKFVNKGGSDVHHIAILSGDIERDRTILQENGITTTATRFGFAKPGQKKKISFLDRLAGDPYARIPEDQRAEDEKPVPVVVELVHPYGDGPK